MLRTDTHPHTDGLADFLAVRDRLLRIAARIVGGASDAEDVVQDAWLRWNRTDRSVVARIRVDADASRPASPAAQGRLLGAFLHLARTGNPGALAEVARDADAQSDGWTTTFKPVRAAASDSALPTSDSG
jgi:hypothetical protein